MAFFFLNRPSQDGLFGKLFFWKVAGVFQIIIVWAVSLQTCIQKVFVHSEFMIPSMNTRSMNPLEEKQPQIHTFLPLCFTIPFVQSGWNSSPGFLHTKSLPSVWCCAKMFFSLKQISFCSTFYEVTPQVKCLRCPNTFEATIYSTQTGINWQHSATAHWLLSEFRAHGFPVLF